MCVPAFDFDLVFAPDDYLYFYQARLSDERTEGEVELVWRLLDLEPGTLLLDLACGHGLIAQRLAQSGCRVVGLDASAGFLALARRAAATLAQQGLNAPAYVRADMRQLPLTARFDAIVNWFTAFGYFDDQANRAVLREAQQALRPAGKLLLELNHRDYLLAHLQHAAVVERDGSYLLDQMRYDVATGRMLTERTVLRDGQTRRMHFFVRLLTFPELRDWLLGAGFSQVEGFDEHGGPLALESRRMAVLATK